MIRRVRRWRDGVGLQPVHWFAEAAGGATVELRDICSLNESETPLESLPEASCWLIGPTEGRLAELQSNLDLGVRKRVALRDLFPEAGQK